jgi:hypothetical protein
MSKMKASALMLGAMAMMVGGDQGFSRHNYQREEETPEERKKRLAKVEIIRNQAKGLKEFKYGSSSIWAINQKNADKKAKRNKWI